ncbi:TnsA endonuclease N-terminal domain-containing protein [Pararoseomonas baculiformis]|nr:TnsA endonuclease N-terminal domain-containing protein [Pararoseomonas baculiformis]
MDGATYRPFLEVGDVSSSGFTSAVPSKDGARSEHVFSRLEKGALLLFRRDPTIVEYREQVALWPIEETDEIARSLGFRRLRDRTGKPYVVTTDFLLFREDGTREGVFVKPMEVLLNFPRESDKAAIEAEFWRRRGVGFRILTDEELTDGLITNLEIFLDHQKPPEGFADPERQRACLDALRTALDGSSYAPLRRVCLSLDWATLSPEGSHIALLKHLLSMRRLSMDLGRRLRAERPYRIGGRWLLPLEDQDAP